MMIMGKDKVGASLSAYPSIGAWYVCHVHEISGKSPTW